MSQEQQGQEIDTEKLLADIEAPAEPRAMSAPEGETPPAPAAEAPATPDWRSTFDWTVERNGQKFVADSAEKAKTWLSLGVNASERGRALTQREQELNALAEKYKGFDRYGEVDTYAKQNPEWWKFVEEQWAQRDQQRQQLDPSLAPVLNPLLERLGSMESFVQTLQEQKRQQELESQDKALDAEIESIRKANPNIDFASVDESGRTLEYRVLKHASENGINSFRAAFRDYLHDKLVEEAKAQSLSQQAQGQTKAVKAGVLGKTPAPTKAAPEISHKGKSWDQLGADVLKEYGLSS